MEKQQQSGPISGTVRVTQKKQSGETQSTSENGESERALPSPPKFESLDVPLSDSKEHWQKPRNIKELAANINTVANAVLNGTIDLRTAQVYGALVRVVAQATSLEVTRGRFLKEIPDLTLEEGETK